MKIVLRQWTISDAKALAIAANDQRVQDNLRDGLPYPYTESDGESFISEMLQADPDKVFSFAITLEEKVIGSIAAFRQQNIHRLTAEVGYYLAQSHWGKGYMTNALQQLCSIIFSSTDIVRLYAEPFSSNAASCRVLEKAGFTYEGTLRSNAVKKGKIIDMKMYSIIKNERG